MDKYKEEVKQMKANKLINEQLKAQYEKEYQQYLVDLEEFNK